jgi:hypothetical protein
LRQPELLPGRGARPGLPLVKSRAYHALRHLKQLMAAPYASSDDILAAQAGQLPA